MNFLHRHPKECDLTLAEFREVEEAATTYMKFLGKISGQGAEAIAVVLASLQKAV